MRRWLLPEAIEDVLPLEARHLEPLRRRLLDLFDTHGYELVMPPLLEYLESLLTGFGPRSRLAHLQAGRSTVRPHHRRARRHHAAGGAHRCASAQPAGRDALVLLRQRAAHAARGAQYDSRAAPDRRRDLRSCRPRGRCRDHPAAGEGLGRSGRRRFAARSRPRRRVRRLPNAPVWKRSSSRSCSPCCRPRTSRPCASWSLALASRYARPCWRCRSSTAARRYWRRRCGACRRTQKSPWRWRSCASWPVR